MDISEILDIQNMEVEDCDHDQPFPDDLSAELEYLCDLATDGIEIAVNVVDHLFHTPMPESLYSKQNNQLRFSGYVQDDSKAVVQELCMTDGLLPHFQNPLVRLDRQTCIVKLLDFIMSANPQDFIFPLFLDWHHGGGYGNNRGFFSNQYLTGDLWNIVDQYTGIHTELVRYFVQRTHLLAGVHSICHGDYGESVNINNSTGSTVAFDRLEHGLDVSTNGGESWTLYNESKLPEFVANLFQFHQMAYDSELAKKIAILLQLRLLPCNTLLE